MPSATSGRYSRSRMSICILCQATKTLGEFYLGTHVYFSSFNSGCRIRLNILANNNPHARNRYFEHFGRANHKVSLNNHTLVLLDAPLLVEEDYLRAKVHKTFDEWRATRHGSVEFVRSFRNGSEEDHKGSFYSNNYFPQIHTKLGIAEGEPVILFSHIPLFRPDTASCGPLRERGSIHRGAGPGYQNTLGKLTTQFIFEHINPSLVFR
jgi:ethanolamine phosphate phosphodiesterase